jgi:phosphohistidine phosphatase SixA
MGKKVLLTRHAQHSNNWVTGEGKNETRAADQRIIEAGVIPECILTSPQDRAVQTAEVLRDVFRDSAGKEVPVRISKSFDVTAESSVALSAIRGLDDENSVVAIVTHEEIFSFLQVDLFGRDANVRGVKQSEVRVLDCDRQGWAEFDKGNVVHSLTL